MLKPVIILIVALNLLSIGCNRQSIPSERHATQSGVSTGKAIDPRSLPGPQKSPASAKVPLEPTLVIDVNSTAEIGGVVRCIFQDSNGVLWVGGEGDLFRNDGKTVTTYDIQDELGKGVTIKQIIEDKDGHIWCGTTHNGISRFDGKAFTNFTADEIVDGKEIWCIHEDTHGNIWFSGKHFGVYQYDGNTFTQFDESDGINSAGVMSILEDTNGRLWLGGVQGLFRYDGSAFVQVTRNGPWQ